MSQKPMEFETLRPNLDPDSNVTEENARNTPGEQTNMKDPEKVEERSRLSSDLSFDARHFSSAP
jgi:hypothetical protein